MSGIVYSIYATVCVDKITYLKSSNAILIKNIYIYMRRYIYIYSLHNVISSGQVSTVIRIGSF